MYWRESVKKAQIWNLTKNNMLLREAEVADSFSARLRGLIGRSGLVKDTGLIITPCNSVHMMGMKFSIDVIFVDKNHRIIKIIPNMKKRSVSPVIWKAKYVIEAPAGTVQSRNLEINDQIELS
jgi:uncharacterized membrane protein (UPF0127 family)